MKIKLAHETTKDIITSTVPFGWLRLLGFFDARNGVVRVSERGTLRLMEYRMLLTVALLRARLDEIVRAVLFVCQPWCPQQVEPRQCPSNDLLGRGAGVLGKCPENDRLRASESGWKP